ncbi:MAG TPA: 50S ribosomal protein L11 methyltransferase [Longimicrobium sp.]|uniref:50S ribosomal protein L11 methyltransferase n=1 Tax=Longimicrobium sp. TaxID=2029185 RepID=UPI002ED9CEC6
MAETYTLRGHAAMIADRVRMDAYQAALERTVRPGSVVLDIGTGTGLMALMACRLGARRVFAADPGDSIRLARAAARASGFADRIEFIQGLSTQIELPERADVIVSDLRGVLPLFQHHVASLADARDRLLAPGGVLIPRMDTLFAAPVQAEKDYQAIVGPWDDHGRGFALDAARRAALNEWNKTHFGADDLLAPPRVWAVLDYRTERNPHVRGTLRWTAERAATAHGFAVWFDAELAEGAGFTTGPDGEKTIYGTAFFPWLAPVPLAEGDVVEVELQARLIHDEYVWVWNTRVEGPDGEKARFRQSTFLAQPATTADLRKRAHDFRPVLGEQGRVDQLVLGMMDGGATLEEIANALQRRFPERFRVWEEALSRAGQLSQAYAQ